MRVVLVGLGVAGCAAPVCYGDAARCALTVPEVTLPGAHNAFNAGDSGFALPNHDLGLAAQLEGGVRAFLMDTYVDEGEVVLCHGPCALGRQPLVEAASVFAAFVEAHPTEPVLWIVQDGAPADLTVAALEAGGLGPWLWTWGAGWPTLGELVEAGRPVMITAEGSGEGPPTWTSFYDRGFDTAYDFRSADELDCDPLRGEPGQGAFLINHWLSTPLPTRDGAAEVNTAEALRARVADCAAARGWRPSVLAVDFWEVGAVVEVAGELTEEAVRGR